MRAADFGRLVALAAIWGASFLFTRIVAPVLGPVLTADLRMLVAGLALVAYFRLVGFDPDWRRWGRKYALVGLLNSGLPFLLYAYSALYLSAGLMAVLNATAPMWGALFTVLLLGERLTGRRAAGLALGVAGVAVLSRPDAGTTQAFLAIAACLAASFLYGLAGVYMKRWAGDVPARGMAVGTQVAAGLLMLPLIPFSPPPAGATVLVAASVLALGLLCGAVAYLLYFRLIVDIGPAGALTVTYLIPLFGVLWGTLFLGEALSITMLAGGVLVVLGTVFVLRN
jgi:drug/metabolite transporter (DMT)-like permease